MLYITETEMLGTYYLPVVLENIYIYLKNLYYEKLMLISNFVKSNI